MLFRIDPMKVEVQNDHQESVEEKKEEEAEDQGGVKNLYKNLEFGDMEFQIEVKYNNIITISIIKDTRLRLGRPFKPYELGFYK